MWYFIRKDLLQLQLFGSVAMDSCLEYTTTPAAVFKSPRITILANSESFLR